jgi:hypothetical protein
MLDSFLLQSLVPLTALHCLSPIRPDGITCGFANVVRLLHSTRSSPLLIFPQRLITRHSLATSSSMFEVSSPLPLVRYSAADRCRFLVQCPIAEAPMRWAKADVAASTLGSLPYGASRLHHVVLSERAPMEVVPLSRPLRPASRRPRGRIEAASQRTWMSSVCVSSRPSRLGGAQCID